MMKLNFGQLIFALFLLFINFAKAQDYGNFPYFQPFNSGIKPSDVTIPSNSDAITFTTNGMILTPAQNTRFGAAYLNNIRFYSPQGIRLEFEYGMYGGNGADGLSVFLFDAAVTNPQIGARGDALAYNYNRANNIHSTTRQAGLTGAYLGIGLDAFGNYKSRVFQGERRKNGFGGTLTVANNQVSLRGAAGKTSLGNNGRGIGYNGYPLLATKSTRSATSGGAILNNDGTFTTTAGTAANFNLGTTALGLTPSDANFRKAYVDLLPNAAGGYNVTVKIQHGATTTTIIDNYHYKTSLTYVENANPNSTDFSNDEGQGANSTHVLDATIPEYFRIGFGASTGGFNNVHSIRNLKIMIPYAAESNDDTFNLTCTTNSINVLTNDLAYTNFAAPTASTNNIYKPSFRFLNATGVPQGQTYNDPAVGIWTYNPTTGIVSLSPIAGFSGAGKVQYDIKGGGSTGTESPFDKDAYRSAPATITANVTALATAPNVVSTLNNNCSTPSSTVNLNNAFIGTVPANLRWFNNNLHSGTALTASEIANTGAGTYYAFYYNSVTTCYSAASAPVVVTITPCPTCPVVMANLSPYNGESTSDYVFSNNEIKIGTNRLHLINTTALSPQSLFSVNRISDTHYAGEVGIQIGHSKNVASGISYAERITSTLIFEDPMSFLKFTINDIDLGDNVIINAYDENGVLINIGASNFYMYNPANITRNGNRFYPTSATFESNNNTREGTVDINFNDKKVSKVVFEFYDTAYTGTYSISKISGEACPNNNCTKPGDFTPSGNSTKVGITVQEKQESWPTNIPNGFIALESKAKGMVITRVEKVGGGKNGAPDLASDSVKDPKEGMLVYDIQAQCVKLYNGRTWKCLEKDCNTAFMLDCSNIIIQGDTMGPVVNFTITIPYMNGDGSSYANQIINSAGLAGMTATLVSGNLANGSGNLVLNVSGTIDNGGDAYFQLKVNGSTCILLVPMTYPAQET